MKRWAPILVLVLLGGCAAPPVVRPPDDRLRAYQDRRALLESWTAWGFTGRLGVDAGEDGGSGRLDWDDAGDLTTLRFRGALGQGAWRMSIEPGEARLERADGSVRRADDVEGLVFDETGWNLPVTALDWWVRGLAWADGPEAEELVLNDDGTPAVLRQVGWRVEFTRFTAQDGTLLPSRLEAARDDVIVKLAVSRWYRSHGAKSSGLGDD